MPKTNSTKNQTAEKTLHGMLEFFPKAREATKKRRNAIQELRNKLKEKPVASEEDSSRASLSS